jgi:uncharacterized protein YegL
MAEQMPFFGDVSFAENPEPRCPCVLLLDTSGSMAGEAIHLLNSGLLAYRDDLQEDTLACKRVEVAIVTFGGEVRTALDFTTSEGMHLPTLSAGGETPMGAAIKAGIEMIRERKERYRANGIMFYRPWIFMITDGAPTDEWRSAAAAIAEGDRSKAFAFFAVGVRGANMDVLRQISTTREPLMLDGLKFRELFQWLSNSQQSVSRSNPGQEVPLKAPTGWASV